MDVPAEIHIVPRDPTAEWCERCNTSAILTFPLAALCDNGVLDVGQISGCTTCDPGIVIPGGVVVPWTFGDG